MPHISLSLVSLIWIAGAVQLADVLANVAVPSKIGSRENLARVSPIVRQVFWSHWFYIGFVLVFFGILCLAFAPLLAGGTPVGRFLSGTLAVFWLLRVPLQMFWFDGEFRRRHRLADLALLVSSAFM